MNNGILVIAAFVLDAFVGEFRSIPHPVQGFGVIIGLFNRVFNREGNSPAIKTAAGFFMAVIVACSGYLVPYLLIRYAYAYLPAWAGFALTLLLAYTTLSVKGLADSAREVIRPLLEGDMESARRALSMIVGRDTGSLDERGVTRGAVETVAENASDGVVAPLFYMAIGGVPLAMMYKAVNTMDSMVGYKDEKYRDFGRYPALIDDIANFIPARITSLYMILAAWVLSFFRPGAYSASGSIDILFRDRLNHKSPNSGYPEAAMAGALGVRLGGPSEYFGMVVDKPFIGDETSELTSEKVRDAVRLLYVTGAAAALDLAVFGYIISAIGG